MVQAPPSHRHLRIWPDFFFLSLALMTVEGLLYCFLFLICRKISTPEECPPSSCPSSFCQKYFLRMGKAIHVNTASDCVTRGKCLLNHEFLILKIIRWKKPSALPLTFKAFVYSTKRACKFLIQRNRRQMLSDAYPMK